MGLSVTIITKNGSETIRKCLESVKWAEEIIVLDSGSTDNTIAIAREYTPHVYETDWPGYAKQKQRALDKATQEWVLNIDEDEWLSPELAQEMQEVVANSPPDVTGYHFKQVRYIGDILLKSGWSQGWHPDLFRREGARYSDDFVHEHPIFAKGRSEKLKNIAYHLAHRDVTELIEKMNRYSSLGAKDKLRKGRKGGVLRAFVCACWMFFKAYFLRGSWVDGAMGFIIAVNSAEITFYRYVKIRFKDKE